MTACPAVAGWRVLSRCNNQNPIVPVFRSPGRTAGGVRVGVRPQGGH